MNKPIELVAQLVVGTVESVSPNNVEVVLDQDAPQSVSLNTGTPSPFPKLNSYVLIPNEGGATVAHISWIGIERSNTISRRTQTEMGLIDLPFPLRRMQVSPVGTLLNRREKGGGTTYELTRGVVSFPSLGDQVLVPTAEQLSAIIGGQRKSRKVQIGSSPLASATPIMVDPDKLFGRHLAVLGNTGSGKSCSVAGLIRWSLDAAEQKIAEKGEDGPPNARFIVLDPNGEYARTFSDKNARVFRVPPVTGEDSPLEIPAWMWNGHEWTAVAHAQSGAQRPLLMQALRDLKAGNRAAQPFTVALGRYLTHDIFRLNALLQEPPSAGLRYKIADALKLIEADYVQFSSKTEDPVRAGLNALVVMVQATLQSAANGHYWRDFPRTGIEQIVAGIQSVVNELPHTADATLAISEDAPVPFPVDALADHLDRSAMNEGANFAAFVATLGLRIRSMLADKRLGAVIGADQTTSFEAWLESYIGSNNADNGNVAVIDLSLIPSELTHIIVSVLARLVFESLQRYRRSRPDGKALPTVLVLEEAHTFVKRGNDDAGGATTPSQLCREIFERIAREGRKFGLGLVLSSQRPSELSPTILAQCNTFLLHRIVNDADQALVARLVPDNVAGLLKELPSLPSRQAILLGLASPIPLLVEMSELPEALRPQSDDPDYWDVWTKVAERDVNWANVIADWTGIVTAEVTTPSTDDPDEEWMLDEEEPTGGRFYPDGSWEPDEPDHDEDLDDDDDLGDE